MGDSRRARVFLAGLLISALSAGGIAMGASPLLVQLVGNSSNDLACIDPATPLLRGFGLRGRPSIDHQACLAALLAERAKGGQTPSNVLGAGLTWFAAANGLEFMLTSGSTTLPVTHGVVLLPSLTNWVYYGEVHPSGVGVLHNFSPGSGPGGTGGVSTGSTSRAVASDAAAATGTGTSIVGQGVLTDLSGITEVTFTALDMDGNIDQRMVCASGSSRRMTLDQASTPGPDALVLPSSLSNGQRQRVGIARAVPTASTIVLWTFPTGCTQDYDVSGLRKALGLINPFS